MVSSLTEPVIIRLIRDLENLLNRKVDVAIASDLKPRIKEHVLREAIAI